MTIVDTNNTLADLDFSASGIKVTRSGNSYTFTSDKMITSAVTIAAQKKVNLNCGDKLIWGSVGKQTMVSGASDPVYFYFRIDTETYGTGHIKKTSEDGVVSGIKFNISGNGVNETVTTKADGTADISLMPSVYTVTEQSIDKYEPQNVQRVTIVSSHTSTVTFNNVLKRGSLEVVKNSDAGAVYGIFKGEELIDSYTTDANGQFTTKYYVCGYDWTIREITPSEGYLLDTTVHKVGAEPELYKVELNSTANDVTEQVIKGNIAIIKHTDSGETQIETPEEGAVFEVFLKSAGSYDNAKATQRDILTCDENGFAQTKDMPYGIYTVRQTSGWEGRELMRGFDVFISKDGHTYRYLINNANFESYIKVVKKDAETGKTIPYAGGGLSAL